MRAPMRRWRMATSDARRGERLYKHLAQRLACAVSHSMRGASPQRSSKL
jgi:hypothetical protein